MFVPHQPKPRSKIVGITQNLDEYKRLAGKDAALRDWQHKLSRGNVATR